MPEHPVILFDGVCNLCDGLVQWIIRHDRAGQFRFASLQSDVGKELLQKHGLQPGQMATMILCLPDHCLVKSDAALEVLTRLPGGWRLLQPLQWLPRGLRNWGYDLVAQNRYRLFGRRESCLLPTPELRERFLSI